MFEFLIDDLEGKTLLGDLENVGACYPDDDVIYMFGVPCRLSSARPAPCALDGGESVAKVAESMPEVLSSSLADPISPHRQSKQSYGRCIVTLKFFIPQNRLTLHLFWFLVSNADTGNIIPYDKFIEITKAYENTAYFKNAISKIRACLAVNGYEIISRRGIGYLCYKVEEA